MTFRCHPREGGDPELPHYIAFMDPKQPAIYILASGRNGTLYIGVTSDLVHRVWQHKNHCVPGFTDRYEVDLLVHYELHATMEDAIVREKRLKKWDRAWKVRLIEERNPEWVDLWEQILGSPGSPPSRG
jgi:putative endonuclease